MKRLFLLFIVTIVVFCPIKTTEGIVTNIHIDPNQPTDKDSITIVVSGVESAGPVLIDSDFFIEGPDLELDIFLDIDFFFVDTPWSHSEVIGTLPAGIYDLSVYVYYSGPYIGTDTYSTSFMVMIEADVEIEPKTLNLASGGEWLNCRIWLPEGYNVSDIEPNSVVLEGEPNDIYAEWIWFNEKQNIVMAKFNRSEVQQMLDDEDIIEIGKAELTVSGELANGTVFVGTDVIRVIDKARPESKPRPALVNSNSKVVDGIEYYIQTDKSVYKLGEDVEMLYRVTNLRDEDVTFVFPCIPEWNFWVEKDGEYMWRAVNGWFEAMTEFTLSPDQSKVFPHPDHPRIWNMKDREGNLITPGKYNIIGGLYAGCGSPSEYFYDYIYDYTKIAVPIKIIRNF